MSKKTDFLKTIEWETTEIVQRKTWTFVRIKATVDDVEYECCGFSKPNPNYDEYNAERGVIIATGMATHELWNEVLKIRKLKEKLERLQQMTRYMEATNALLNRTFGFLGDF